MKKTYLTILLSLWATLSWGQEITVTGTIKDEFNELLSGVNVLIKGSVTGTVTDGNGYYELQLNASDTLRFSYIGYEIQTIPVEGQTTIDVILVVKPYKRTTKSAIRNFFLKISSFFERVFSIFQK